MCVHMPIDILNRLIQAISYYPEPRVSRKRFSQTLTTVDIIVS